METKNFALVIQQTSENGKTEYHVESRNDGIPTAEIILTVEGWLEKVKRQWNDERFAGFVFKK